VRDRFRLARIDTPERDARLLAERAFAFDALALSMAESPDAQPAALDRLDDLARRRLAGDPVARILGEGEFYGLDFGLNEATLVPRPETELLVDLALAAIGNRPNPTVLDLGTGTGCIPIAILANAPWARAVAVDLAPDALRAANANAARHAVLDRLDLLEGSWFDPLPAGQKFDLIVSNPPYIETAEIAALAPEVSAFDPRLALDGGGDGLDAYRTIAMSALDRLQPGGVLLLEIGSLQAKTVTRLLEAAGFARIWCHKDLAGLDRVVEAHHLLGVTG